MLRVFICLILIGRLTALPNAVLGALAQNQSPLNGNDLTEVILAAGVWDGSEDLPGEWVADAGMVGVRSSYLMARPKVMGLDALLVRALHREEKLEELQITFADAGSFFGYFDMNVPEGLSQEEARELVRKKLREKQEAFTEVYHKTSSLLKDQLDEIDKRPKRQKRGRVRDLRAEVNDFQDKKRDLVIRMLSAPDRLLRISVFRKGEAPKTWLDREQEQLGENERLRELSRRVKREENGDVFIKQVEVVPQGYRPYCGLNTLTMVARYFGLHLDEDWLAVAGKFQNTGSAAGSDMLGLYHAVAKEAKFSMNRIKNYDHADVRRSVQAGMPVIVWRRWDRTRDQLHSQISRKMESGESVTFEQVEENQLPSKAKKSPLHSSVIIGFNDERKEVIFLESWGEKAKSRRMPIREMSLTTDLTFCFRP